MQCNPDRPAMGHTILELLVALAIAGMVVLAAAAMYHVQELHSSNQQMLHTSRHNLWGGLMVMAREIRKAGYDPEDSGQFGIVDVRRYDVINANALNPAGQPVLFYTCDTDENGGLDRRNGGRNREHPKFRIADIHNDGNVCLTWDNGSGRRPLASRIQAMGLAFAVDADGNGRLDTDGQNGPLIWAVDSDNDNLLDATIDTNGDGFINEDDDVNADGKIDWADGARLQRELPLSSIRVVKVWLMAQTRRPLQHRESVRKHVVGDRIYPSSKDGRGRSVVTVNILCRNL